jgi:hypothetical protein
MPSWLIDDPTLLYLILGVAAVAVVVALGLKRDGPWLRIWIASLVGVVLLVGAVVLLDLFVVSDGEKIVKSIEGMSAGVQKRDPAEVLTFVSKDFQLGDKRRANFEAAVKNAVPAVVDEVVVFDLEPPVVEPGGKKATVKFGAKPKKDRGFAADPRGYRVTATFVLEADGEWRLQTFEALDPQDGRPIPLSVIPW